MSEARIVSDGKGGMMLVDPVGSAAVRAVERHNCATFLDEQADRVGHFARRIGELGRDPRDVVIVVLDVDDADGGAIADVLMPGHDWQAVRDRGERPVARGLAGREGITVAVAAIDPEAANDMRKMPCEVVVVAVARGVAVVRAVQRA